MGSRPIESKFEGGCASDVENDAENVKTMPSRSLPERPWIFHWCVSVVVLPQLYGHDRPRLDVKRCEYWMYVAVIKAVHVSKVELRDWKLALLLWASVLSSSRLCACWTPTPVGKVCHVVLQYLLWCWLLWCL